MNDEGWKELLFTGCALKGFRTQTKLDHFIKHKAFTQKEKLMLYQAKSCS